MNQTTSLFHAGHTFPGLHKCPVDRAHLARRQAVFDLAIKALRQQGSAAYRPDTGCAYLDAETGNRCGIGHLIAPAYDPALEGMTWDCIGNLKGVCAEAAAAQRAVEHIDRTYGLDSGGVDLLFLSALQAVHDSADHRLRLKHLDPAAPHDFPGALEHYASHMAAQWGLTLPAKE